MRHLFLFVLITVGSYSFLFAKNNTSVSVQLLWKHQFEFAGYYMAIEKGFYKEAGLDVTLKEYQFGTNLSDLILQEDSQFGVGSSSLILDNINGKNLTLIFPMLQNSPFVLMSKKRADIQNVVDLKNKKVMLTPNQISMAALNAMLKINKVSKKEFIEVEHSFNINDLINDKVDAMAVYMSNEPYYMIAKGIEYTIFDPNDYGFNFYEDILFTSKNYAKKNPIIVKKFYEATLKGWEYAFTHIYETSQLIMEKYNSQNKTLNHILYEAEQLKKMSNYGENTFGKFKPEVISQIIQTYNLLDISKSTIKIDDLLYKDAIFKHEDINFSLIIKFIVGAMVILLGFYYWNRKLANLNNQILENKKKLSLLLDNAGQGFLTFEKDFIIDSEYSKECEKLLGSKIEHQDIATILFDDHKKQEMFKNTLLSAINEPMILKRNAYLSLVSSQVILNKKAIKLEYKIIEEKIFMLILTNVTTQKKLENKIKKEEKLFKMIVSIASQSEVFYDLIDEYEQFINNTFETKPLDEIFRIVHTFKGLFSQLYMQEMVESLHNLETSIADLIASNTQEQEKINSVLKQSDHIKKYFQLKQTIQDILGQEFIYSHHYAKIDIKTLFNLQQKIAKLHNQDNLSKEIKEIFFEIENLNHYNLMQLLFPYGSMVQKLAERFEKQVYELKIEGDHAIIVPQDFKPFFKSLVHLFKNSIDHGIESPEERVMKNKDQYGTLQCSFFIQNQSLHLIISDDGAGLHKESILKKSLQKGIDTSNFSEEEIFSLIFLDNFSTKENLTQISGRGVGMAAVNEELKKINGNVKISSIEEKGTEFYFIIPLKNTKD